MLTASAFVISALDFWIGFRYIKSMTWRNLTVRSTHARILPINLVNVSYSETQRFEEDFSGRSLTLAVSRPVFRVERLTPYEGSILREAPLSQLTFELDEFYFLMNKMARLIIVQGSRPHDAIIRTMQECLYQERQLRVPCVASDFRLFILSELAKGMSLNPSCLINRPGYPVLSVDQFLRRYDLAYTYRNFYIPEEHA